jgi:hypothetical protein
MKSHWNNIALCVCAVTALAAMGFPLPLRAAVAQTKATPPDSFLKIRVNSVSELCKQVNTDPAVKARYSHLLGVPQDKVVSYFKNNLVESYIPSGKTYRVWCVSKSGRYFQVNQKLNSGARVLALRDGSPVLKWACGNPLVSHLPAAVPLRQSVAKRPLLPDDNIADYNETIAKESLPDTPMAMSITSLPTETPVAVPTYMVAGVTETLIPSSAGSKIGALSLLPLGGLAGLVSSSSSGSKTVIQTNDDPTVTPEPSSVFALFLGLVGIVALLYRRRSAKLS